jgi:hypothetical protein
MSKLTGKEADMAKEIQAVLAKYGYTTTRYFISRDEATSRLTINVVNPTANGETASKDEVFGKEYRARASFYGFKPEWLGRTFTYDAGRQVTLVGFRPGTRSQNFVVYRHNGKLFVTKPFGIQTVLEALDKKSA